MVALGAWNYNVAMTQVAEGGEQEIVNQMIELGAMDYEMAIYSVARGLIWDENQPN
jgi:hypothetical protein